MAYIKQDVRHEKKFRYIVELILTNQKFPTLYDKEDFCEDAKGVTAMKLFKGQENDRIYCKEIRRDNKNFIVVAAELSLKKKTQKLKQKDQNLILKVASYEYEFKD